MADVQKPTTVGDQIAKQEPQPTSQRQAAPVAPTPVTEQVKPVATPVKPTAPATQPVKLVPEGHPAQGVPASNPELVNAHVASFKIGDKVMFEGVVTNVDQQKGVMHVQHISGHGSALEFYGRDLRKMT